MNIGWMSDAVTGCFLFFSGGNDTMILRECPYSQRHRLSQRKYECVLYIQPFAHVSAETEANVEKQKWVILGEG